MAGQMRSNARLLSFLIFFRKKRQCYEPLVDHPQAVITPNSI